MSDTPETDAAVEASGGDWSPVLRAVAQRLERERDAALDAIYNYKLEVEAWELLAQARRERDEARADAARLADILSGLELRTTQELARLERERNAALELAEAFHRDQVTLLLERDSTNDCKK